MSFTDPELGKRVDALAADTRIESSHIGDAGSPSAVYAHFEAVRALASESDLALLLGHPSVVVRG